VATLEFEYLDQEETRKRDVMGRIAASLTGVLAAAPALAHEGGAHMHPHGAEGWLALLPAAALVMVALFVAKARK
jgi:hypothetical protein